MIIEIDNLSLAVPGRTLFTGLTCAAGPGQSLAVVGPSGVGKSTLVSTILGLHRPASGTITILGRNISAASPREALSMRREHMGVVFQHGELMDELTATENVAVASLMVGDDDLAISKARALLEKFGVPPGTKARDLSGGERQRTAFARALVTEPELIIADEPTGSLDTYTRDQVADDLFAEVARRGAALIVVTHDLTVAERATTTIELDRYA
ncbi:MAG: ATP-binding cassette domain-containing protein [Flaviflexus sp.]|nr:ATP-binding cassette domain-containing protein [Flaviflexus sp.]